MKMSEYFSVNRGELFQKRLQKREMQRDQMNQSQVSTYNQTAADSYKFLDETQVYQNLNNSTLIDVKVNLAKRPRPLSGKSDF